MKLGCVLALALGGCHLVFPLTGEHPTSDGPGVDRARLDGSGGGDRRADAAAPPDSTRDQQRLDQRLLDQKPVDKKLPGDQQPLDKKLPGDQKPLDQQLPADQKLACDQSKIGMACLSAADCPLSMECFGFVSGLKVCTCSCLPDIIDTPMVNEDTCPGAGSFAGAIRCVKTATKPKCVRICAPKLYASDCASGVACQPLDGPLDLSGKSACVFPPCTSSSCRIYTGPCGPANPCGPGSYCQALGPSGVGRCWKPGACNPASGICGPRSSGAGAIGSPCVSDEDCPANGYCEAELDRLALGFLASGKICVKPGDCCSNQCVGGICTGPCRIHSRNGYCTSSGCAFASTLTFAGCLTGATCSLAYPGGRCLKPCDLSMAQTCRGITEDRLADYECRAWNNLQISGLPITGSPVCEWGDSMPCNNASKLSCAIVGLNGNPTAMSCRSPLDNAPTLSSIDPDGLCLDATTSGPPPP